MNIAKAICYISSWVIGIAAFSLFCHDSFFGMLVTVLGCGALMVFKR